jgi:hypothetical protein
MKRQTAYVIGGIGVAVLGWVLIPHWVVLLLLVAIVAAPAVAYAILDPSQKRRLKGLARKQIGPGSRR